MACGYTPEKHLMHTLRRQLRKAALERVKDCYWVWTRPKLAGTFCSLWASGQVQGLPFVSMCFELPRPWMRLLCNSTFAVDAPKVSVHPQLGPFCVERRRKELRAVGNIAPVARELNKGAGWLPRCPVVCQLALTQHQQANNICTVFGPLSQEWSARLGTR